MLLISHILIALSSLAYTTYTFFSPSKTKLRAAYVLVAATLGTGALLVIENPVHMVSACISGLTYTGAVSIGIVLAQRKLATQESRKESKL